MRTELEAVGLHLVQLAQAEGLKAAAVREYGLAPGIELVQAAAAGHQLVAGAQVQMIGVAEDDLSAEGVEIVGGKGFHTAHGAYGHENGSLYGAVRRVQYAGTGGAVFAEKFEGVYL